MKGKKKYHICIVQNTAVVQFNWIESVCREAVGNNSNRTNLDQLVKYLEVRKGNLGFNL